MNNHWTERNGETTPPDISKDECKWFWFDGIAHYEDWSGRGNLIVTGAKHTDRVMGLVFVMRAIDMKHPKLDAQGRYIRDRSIMIAVPETNGYELHQCEGKWYGPVEVPNWSDEFMPTLAFVDEYVAEHWTIDEMEATDGR